MTSEVRRRVLRRPATPLLDPHQQRLHERRRAELQRERMTFDRWMVRLRRAIKAVERSHAKITRIERRLATTHSD